MERIDEFIFKRILEYYDGGITNIEQLDGTMHCHFQIRIYNTRQEDLVTLI